MKFYIGLHHPNDAQHFDRCFISVNALRDRKKKPVPCNEWILDSGAFSEIAQYGRFRESPAEYATEVNRLAACNPGLKIAVSQDYMCEPVMLEKTGLTVADHQRLTIERYDELLPLVKPYLMPVLQGYSVRDYLNHIDQYGKRLAHGMYVGVGSVCKRNVNMREIEGILSAIKNKRPDLRLHGFGIKRTALQSGVVRGCLESADSMAWSFAARWEGRNRNGWREAKAFAKAIETQKIQYGWRF